jgi:protein phosphatase 2C
MTFTAHHKDNVDVYFGAHEVRGNRARMEDRCGAFTASTYRVAYVCDGHGGSEVADMIASSGNDGLEELLIDALARKSPPAALRGAFRALDEAADRLGKRRCGSTLCVAVLDIDRNVAVVANCGDSRCMVYDPVNGAAVWQSRDHAASDADEVARIKAVGGLVVRCRGVARVMGTLSVSRSIGDHYLKRFVIGEPDVTEVPLPRHRNACLVVASDGLWFNVDRRDVLAVLGQRGGADSAAGPQKIAEDLVGLASRKRSIDNTSVVVMAMAAL